MFQVAAEELYKALLNKMRTAKAVNNLGNDSEYWTQASNIVLRAKDEVLSRAHIRPREQANEPEESQTQRTETLNDGDRKARLAAERADPALKLRRKVIES